MHQKNDLLKQESELDYWARLYVDQGMAAWNGEDNLSRETFARYCHILGTDQDTFQGLILVDIGCGPLGALHHFSARLKFGVDVLLRCYAGFGCAQQDMIYLAAPAEDLPFLDDFTDAVISVNALDHVDSFKDAIAEIHRILNPGGRILLAFNLNHAPTISEPVRLSQDRILGSMDDKFEIKSWQILPPIPQCEADAPEGIMVVDAIKIPGAPSRFIESTASAIKEVASGISPEQRNADLADKYQAPRSVRGELRAALAFAEFKAGSQRTVLTNVLRAFLLHPVLMLNRGLWSIAVKAMLRRAT